MKGFKAGSTFPSCFPLDLWLASAKWEFEDNNNSENARSMLQRGLRFNDTSKSLWVEV